MAYYFAIGTSARKLGCFPVAHCNNILSIKMLLDFLDVMGIDNCGPAYAQVVLGEFFFKGG